MLLSQGLDSRLRGNDESIRTETCTASFPRKWESRISDFQIIFEYCCYSKVWIPACAGMTAERFLFFPINS
ncbi:hypothetical protein FOG13_08985 [Neisseria meningitidis]|nr:hypothetical protein [Neisseria meningitidis]MBG8689568.1 hypothetical protein [Neisseria meningitidis]MBG8825100.1 hypothetical protein [Neisseria meningitidis]MBG8850411.1 hypothetical protein [Neisseria meningitidis]MBG8852488.1 hypothetical protein [Neisseria meningitidis]